MLDTILSVSVQVQILTEKDFCTGRESNRETEKGIYL